MKYIYISYVYKKNYTYIILVTTQNAREKGSTSSSPFRPSSGCYCKYLYQVVPSNMLMFTCWCDYSHSYIAYVNPVYISNNSHYASSSPPHTFRVVSSKEGSINGS